MRASILTGLLPGLLLVLTPHVAANDACESVQIRVGPLDFAQTARGELPLVENFGRLLVPGKPALPSRIFAVAMPPGAEVTHVTYDLGVGIEIPGEHHIAPAPPPQIMGPEYAAERERQQQIHDRNYAAVYGCDEPFPTQPVEFVRTAGYRQYNLADVRVTPFSYRPRSKQLTAYPNISVHVHYRFADGVARATFTESPRVERVAEDLVVNHARTEEWQGHGLRDQYRFDFVIITLSSLVSAVTPIADWETSKGRDVEVVTTSWIAAVYPGVDLPAKIRNFLRDSYPVHSWGIEDVLIVGDYNDIPPREIEQSICCGPPRTDFYYAELSRPDNQSWDADGDGLYGERSDPVDYYAEVRVGRIPWSDYSTVQHICQKSVSAEQDSDPAYKKHLLALAAFVSDDTDFAAPAEALNDQPWLDDWTVTRMYEQNATVYSIYPCEYELTHANAMAYWTPNPAAFVFVGGHGSPYGVAQWGYGAATIFSQADVPALDDNHPAVVCVDACSTSSTTSLSLGQVMLDHGAVGYLGATNPAYGMARWEHPYDGSSQSSSYLFLSALTSGDYSLGGAHQAMLREMYSHGMWFAPEYEMAIWGLLLGNPDLELALPPALRIAFPDGCPEFIEPGVATDITVEITAAGEDYDPGTGTLYYRYDGGPYVPVPVTPLGGDLYAATLPPPTCGATPEYYISATGTGGTTITSPLDAPATLHTAALGTTTTVIDDDFESDLGWTTDFVGATSGFWQRGVPIHDPNWFYDPGADADGSGQCYLTQNEPGNTDVDDGEVRLTSPLLDMSAGSYTISYDYFLRLRQSAVHRSEDALRVEINNNDGVGDWIELANHSTNGGQSWRHHEITQTDLDAAGVALTPTMRLRFTANDDEPQGVVEAAVDGFRVLRVDCVDLLPGDMNCDGEITFADINPFVLALVDGEAAYTTAYPDCNYMNADMSANGTVGFEDINDFVDLLLKVITR
jgi:hypothetical protein